MKKTIFYAFILLSSLTFFSCQSDDEVYSCDPDVDTWVKKNLTEIRQMTRSEWNEMAEDLKAGAYVAFTSEQKFNFWLEKLDAVLKFDWNDAEREHIEKLQTTIKKNSFWFKDDLNEEELEIFDLFEYRWVEYAKEELNWTDKQIASIAYTGNDILNTDGLISMNEQKNIRLKTIGEPSCDCTKGAFWSMCDSMISNSTCASNSCNEVRNCGFVNSRYCNGVCVP